MQDILKNTKSYENILQLGTFLENIIEFCLRYRILRKILKVSQKVIVMCSVFVAFCIMKYIFYYNKKSRLNKAQKMKRNERCIKTKYIYKVHILIKEIIIFLLNT